MRVSESILARYFLDGFVDLDDPEGIDKSIQDGKIFPFAEVEPAKLEKGDVLIEIMQQYVAYAQQMIDEIQALPRPDDFKDEDYLGEWSSTQIDRLVEQIVARRGITLEEYLDILSLTYDEVFIAEKPVSWDEYVKARFTASSTSPPPIKPDKSKYYWGGSLDSEPYARDMHKYHEAMATHREEKRSVESKDRERKESLRADYQRYKREFDRTHIDPVIRDSPAFTFLSAHVEFGTFLNRNQKTKEGYLAFLETLKERIPLIKRMFEKQSTHIPLAAFQGHNYVTGATRSGKTELLKFIIHQIHQSPKPAVPRSLIIMEPGGDFARELAAHENFQDSEIIYFDPKLDPRRLEDDRPLPAFNPFDFHHTDVEALDEYAQHLTRAIQEILGDLSPQMETLLMACVSVLIRMEGTTFRDLKTFMDVDRCGPYLAFAQKLSNQDQRDFFRNDFRDKKFDPTRGSISTKIQGLLNNDVFRRIICRPSTFDLEHAMNTGKIIIFRLSDIGEDGGGHLGRLLIARIKSIAFARKEIPNPKKRPQTFVFVDEFQNYVDESIGKVLAEGGKYQVFLFLASQTVSQNIDANLAKVVLSNTNTKIAGRNDPATHNKLKDALNVSLDQLQELGLGQFYMRSQMLMGNRTAFKIHVPDWYVGNKGLISADEWKAFKRDQLSRYYSTELEDVENTRSKTKQAAGSSTKRKPKYDV